MKDLRRLRRRDAGYPGLLAAIHDPPPALFVRGSGGSELLSQSAVAVVGARACSAYGRSVARSLGRELAAAGLVVVSGMARGIDGEAHRGALEASGITVAVLGCGIDRDYPAAHAELARRICERGLIVSEYEPGVEPAPWRFPARNRIIAGLSLGVIVIEAPSRSGALITVDFAADQGRDVFAVPGSIFSAASAGCHRLLRDGARPVTCADDVLEELNLGARQSQVAVQQAMPLEEDERRLLALLTGDPQHIDEVAAASARPIHEVNALLVTLELKGLVRNAGAQHYTRV